MPKKTSPKKAGHPSHKDLSPAHVAAARHAIQSNHTEGTPESLLGHIYHLYGLLTGKAPSPKTAPKAVEPAEK